MDPINTVIVGVATYALAVVALGALVCWWQAVPRERLVMLVAGALTLGLSGLAILAAAHAWTDPRPFVVDGRPPLIVHVADNGFPSDHTTIGVAVAATVLAWRRLLGAALLLVALAVGAARVAAHVHHVPDVVGGAVIGLACAAAGVLLARRAVALLEARRPPSRSRRPAGVDRAHVGADGAPERPEGA